MTTNRLKRSRRSHACETISSALVLCKGLPPFAVRTGNKKQGRPNGPPALVTVLLTIGYRMDNLSSPAFDADFSASSG